MLFMKVYATPNQGRREAQEAGYGVAPGWRRQRPQNNRQKQRNAQLNQNRQGRNPRA